MGSTRVSVRPGALLALGLAAGLGLTGCSGSPGPSAGSAVGGAAAGGSAGHVLPSPVGSDASEDGGRTPGDVDPARVPQSTFAMDVDTASYGYARALLADGERPSPDRVRPEEFVNAFRQDYPQPAGNGFTVTMDGARLPQQHREAEDGDVRLPRVGLQTRAEDPATRPDAALTVVVDVSGSVGDPGKLDVVRRALHQLVHAGRR